MGEYSEQYRYMLKQIDSYNDIAVKTFKTYNGVINPSHRAVGIDFILDKPEDLRVQADMDKISINVYPLSICIEEDIPLWPFWFVFNVLHELSHFEQQINIEYGFDKKYAQLVEDQNNYRTSEFVRHHLFELVEFCLPEEYKDPHNINYACHSLSSICDMHCVNTGFIQLDPASDIEFMLLNFILKAKMYAGRTVNQVIQDVRSIRNMTNVVFRFYYNNYETVVIKQNGEYVYDSLYLATILYTISHNYNMFQSSYSIEQFGTNMTLHLNVFSRSCNVFIRK